MNATLEAWTLEFLMVRALEGRPISTWDERYTAYKEYGIQFDGLSFDEIATADCEAVSIEMAKRLP
jgi:hypothetical protein